MTTTGTQQSQTGQSLITVMATKYGLEPSKFYGTLEKTILPSNKPASQEQVAAFLVVANHYDLNPFTKEIYAFPNQSGGISPIVSVDGWLTLINRQPTLDGIEYQDHIDPETGQLTAITCRIYRKDRSRPTEITEYMKECRRNTSTWSQWPARMLRHKALIQCARQAFGLAGIYDPDEAERIELAEQGGNGQPIAEKTRAKVEEMKSRYTPPPTDEAAAEPETAAEPEAIEAEYVDVPATEEAPAQEPVATDPVELLRIAVQAKFDEFPKARQKDLLVGRPSVAKMDEQELTEFLALLEQEQ